MDILEPIDLKEAIDEHLIKWDFAFINDKMYKITIVVDKMELEIYEKSRLLKTVK
jgi:hypothetical protein